MYTSYHPFLRKLLKLLFGLIQSGSVRRVISSTSDPIDDLNLI